MTDSLSFSLGGDISGFERAMNTAVNIAIKNTNSILSTVLKSSSQIDGSIGGLAGSIGKLAGGAEGLGAVGSAIAAWAGPLAVAFIAFEGLKSAVDAASDAAKSAQKDLQALVEIGTKAQGAGVGTTFFQSLTGQAQKLGLEVSQVETMLTQARDNFQVNIGEGDGASASSTALDRIRQNVSAGNLSAGSGQAVANASTLEDKYRATLALLDQLQSKGEQLAEFDLAGKTFGPDFERALRAGVDVIGIYRTALDGIAAGDQGRIRSAQEIAEAQRLSAEYADQNARLAAALAPLQEQVALEGQDILQVMADLRGIYVDVVQEAAALVGYLLRADAVVGDMGKAMATFAETLGSGSVRAWLKSHGIGFNLVDPPDNRSGGSEATRNQAQGILSPIDQSMRFDRSHTLPSLAPAKSSSGGSQSDEVDNLIKSLGKAAAAEQGEAAAAGKSNAERQRSIDLAKADEAAKERGSALTDQERQKIIALADAYSAAHAKIAAANLQKQINEGLSDLGLSADGKDISDKIRGAGLDPASSDAKGLADQLQRLQTLTEAKSDAQTFVDGLVGSLIRGESAAKAFGDELLKLGEKLLDKGLDALVSGAFGSFGSGGLSALLPKFASGTDYAPGGLALVGEAGPELVSLPRGAQVTPNARLRQIPNAVTAPSGPSTVQVTHAPSYTITPAQGVSPDQLAAVIDRNNRQFARQLPELIATANRRTAR